MASPIVVFSPNGTMSKSKRKSPFQLNGSKIGCTLTVTKTSPPAATPATSLVTFHFSPPSSAKKADKSMSKSQRNKLRAAAFANSSFLTPGVVPQRRRSDQDGTPATVGNDSRNAGKKALQPLRASPLFSDSPCFGNALFSASKACQALVHSPCRSENYRRQRRRLYHQDEYDDVKRKLSLPESAGGNVWRTPKLGKGGFGSVYIGKYGGKMAAIKQLHNTSQRKTGQGESLCAELNAFRLNHPNIINILTFTCTGPNTQIVFEYVGRRNLQQLLDDTTVELPSALRIQYCRQVADALRFCHSNRVLHLDVKPSNILVTDDLTSCKVGDFGCSRLMVQSPTNAEPTISMSASTPGTLMYKAPELLRGSNPTPKADVYALGYVMWQCATRQAPFEGMNLHTIVFCVVAKALRPTLKPEIAEKLTSGEKVLIELAQTSWSALPESRPELQEIYQVLSITE